MRGTRFEMQGFTSFARKGTPGANSMPSQQQNLGYASIPGATTETAYLQAHKRLADAQNKALELQSTSSSGISFVRERARPGSENLQPLLERGMSPAMAGQETFSGNRNGRLTKAVTNVMNMERALDTMSKPQAAYQAQTSTFNHNDSTMDAEQKRQQQFQQPRLNYGPPTKQRVRRPNRKANKFKQDNDSSKEDLRLFLAQLEGLIQENNALLIHPDELKESVTQELDEEQAQDKKKRNYLKEMLKNQISNKTQFAMPMWRHIAAGNHNPPPELVMKGIALFKCVANIVIALVVRPRLSVRDKQVNERNTEMRNLMKTLKLYIEPSTNWMGKIVKTPLQTVVQDKTVDFSKAFDGNKSSYQRNTSVTQLKVRLRAIIDNLIHETHPPEHIMGLLQTLVSDGNHFDPDFLYDCEKERLEVNEIGATRNIFEPISDDEYQNNRESFLDPQKYLAIGDVCFRVEQGRMLLMNILFIRLFLNHVVLSPWHCSVCPRPPGKQVRHVIKNLRIVASLLYFSSRSLDPHLPTVSVQEVVVKDEKEVRETEEKIAAEAAVAAVLAGDEVGIDIKDENNDEKIEVKEGTKGGKRDIIKEAIAWLTNRLLLIETRGTDINEDHCERVLFGEKLLRFDSMQEFHNFLLPLEYFVSNDLNKGLFENICKDLRSRLNRWLTKLSLSILHYRMLQEATMEAEDETASRPATVMSTLKSGGKTTPKKDGERINSASPAYIAKERKNSEDSVHYTY